MVDAIAELEGISMSTISFKSLYGKVRKDGWSCYWLCSISSWSSISGSAGATDSDYRCVLTPGDPYMPLPNDEIISRVTKQEIADVAQSESKWKQLGALAMSTGMVYLRWSVFATVSRLFFLIFFSVD